jgi:hypothetical protein
MPVKKATVAEPPIYSEKKIKQLSQFLRDRVAEHMRLQSEGILPYRSRMPVVVIEIYHIMKIMNRSRSTAQRLMAKIRKKRNKKDDEYVSVEDFVKATGLPQWEVQRALDMLT